MTGHVQYRDVQRTLRRGLFATGLFGCVIAYSGPVEQLLNPGFDGVFNAVANTNSSGIIRGVFPANWLDNSRYSGKHPDNLYACEASNTVSGNAFCITAALQSGYSSGLNVELYQPFAAISQRIYTASVWLTCSSNAVAQLVIRQKSSPYSVRAITNCVLTSAWQSFRVVAQSVATESLAVSINLSNQATTLWIDQASCVVQDGGRVWYVAPSGADSNSGSLSAPFQTVARAGAQLNVGDAIALRAGTYRETLQVPLSGSCENPITFFAYNNERVIVSGCDIVAGPWTATGNAIYTASTDWTLGAGYNQLFVDGAMVHEARHPDFGSTDLLNPATAALTVSSNYTVAASAFDGLGDLTGARFYASVGSSWAWQNALIASNRTGTLFLDATSASTWWWPNYGSKASDTGKGFVYGLLRLLDGDGEWIVQTNACAPHTLHLRIAEGVNPAEHLIEMKRRAWCVDLNGQNFVVISNLVFTGGAVRLNGERPNSGYSMINSSGSNIWSGPLTRIGQTRINTTSGSTLVMTGGATGGGSLFVVNTSGTFILAEKPALIGTTGFWADSGGLTILAVSNNVWGDTTLGRGLLRTDVPWALPTNTVVRMGLSYAAGGTLELNGNDQTIAGLLTGTPTAGVRVVASRLPATLTINQSLANATFDGAFTGMVRIIKAGAGAWTLSATNTTTSAGMVISNGSVIAASTNCFGQGPVELYNGTLHNALTNTMSLAMDRLVWHGAGQIRTTLAADGSASRLQIARQLTRGEGTNFVFDFSGSGAPNRTYTLLTFASSSFAVNDFHYRNLGTNRYTNLCGEFHLTAHALTLRTWFPSATLMLIR